MSFLKFQRIHDWQRLTISLLVFLFIFSSPGLLLAVDLSTGSGQEILVSNESSEENTAAAETESATQEQLLTEVDEVKQIADEANQDQVMLLSGEGDDPYYGDERKPVNSGLHIESDMASGALVYSFSIAVPPGRNGMQPDLQLTYNSQAKDNANWLGYGWAINIPYIERINRKGVENLYSENYYTSSLSGELEDISLTDGTHGSYGAKVDNGEFIKYEYNTSNYWLATDKKGTVYKFGYSASTRQDDPSDSTHAYKWMLEEVRDTNNNYIKYEYYKNSGQIYPSKIKYTGYDTTDGIFEVEFLRESRTDDLKSYHPGFEVQTSYRIYEIKAEINNTWVRKYELDYTTGDNGARSLLETITESGQDELSNTITLPENDFAYQTKTAG